MKKHAGPGRPDSPPEAPGRQTVSRPPQVVTTPRRLGPGVACRNLYHPSGKWLARLVEHGDGIALIFARTETEVFHRWGWESADAMLFLRGRLHFHDVDGSRAKANAGGPSVLIAHGKENAERLRTCGLPGFYVALGRGELSRAA